MPDDKRITPDELADRLTALAGLGTMAIFADIDGTISPIAAQPDQAFVLPEAVSALDGLAATGVTVVLVTGRSAADARTMVGLPHLGYAGNHGFELLDGDRHIVGPEVEAATASVAAAVVDVQRLVSEAGIDGILFEDKRYTGSVHFRLAPNAAEAKLRLLPLLRAVVEDRGLRLTEGRLVYELRPALPMNKGVFVKGYLAARPHDTAAFLGDDLTDVDGFRAIQAGRADGRLVAGLCVGVAAPESPAQVTDEADVVVAGTAEMASALHQLMIRLTRDRHD